MRKATISHDVGDTFTEKEANSSKQTNQRKSMRANDLLKGTEDTESRFGQHLRQGLVKIWSRCVPPISES